MLEKLFGARYFGGSIGPLIHHHATFFASSSAFSLLFVVWTTTPTFLGCWAQLLLYFSLISNKMIAIFF